MGLLGEQRLGERGRFLVDLRPDLVEALPHQLVALMLQLDGVLHAIGPIGRGQRGLGQPGDALGIGDLTAQFGHKRAHADGLRRRLFGELVVVRTEVFEEAETSGLEMFARFGGHESLGGVAVGMSRSGDLGEERACARSGDIHLTFDHTVALIDERYSLSKLIFVLLEELLDLDELAGMLGIGNRGLRLGDLVSEGCRRVGIVAEILLAVADEKSLDGEAHARKIELGFREDSDFRDTLLHVVHGKRDLLIGIGRDGGDGEDADGEDAEAERELGTEGERAGDDAVGRDGAREAMAGDECCDECGGGGGGEDERERVGALRGDFEDFEVVGLSGGRAKCCARGDLELRRDECAGCGESAGLGGM